MQDSTSTFTENGVALSFTMATCMLPDTDQMCENAMIETTVNMATGSGAIYNVSAQNQNGSVLQFATIQSISAPTIWGSFTWGGAVWGGGLDNLYPRQVAWTAPVVFRRMKIAVQGASSAALRISTVYMRYEQTGYLQQASAA